MCVDIHVYIYIYIYTYIYIYVLPLIMHFGISNAVWRKFLFRDTGTNANTNTDREGASISRVGDLFSAASVLAYSLGTLVLVII